MKKSQLLIAVCCVLTAGSAYAQPAMYAPWECGTQQTITQGNNDSFSHYDMGLGYSDTWAWDIGMGIGTKVVAPADGVVGYAKGNSSVGGCSASYANDANYVQICYDGNYAGIFWHLSKVYVNVGDHVKRGDVIGLSGQTGYSCGAHLHYAVTYCSQWYNSRPAS